MNDSSTNSFTVPRLAGVNLSLREWGDRDDPIVVLLHGGGANSHWWDHLAPTLAKSHRVVAMDFRGHGDSDHPEDRQVGAFNEDLEALIEYLGTGSVILIGHSMGAHVALDHASRFPETRGVVLIDLSRGAQKGSRRRARLALAFRRTYASREDAIARYRFLPDAEHATEALRESIATHSVREEPDGRFGFKFDPQWFSLPSRPRPDLSHVLCPTLVVRGAESRLLSADGARELVAELPNANLRVIENAGHHVLLDRPGELLAALRTFLRELD